MRSHSRQVFEVIQISDARSLCKGYNRALPKLAAKSLFSATTTSK